MDTPNQLMKWGYGFTENGTIFRNPPFGSLRRNEES